MGPPGNCPCIRQARGEKVELLWTDENQKQLEEFVRVFTNKENKEDNESSSLE